MARGFLVLALLALGASRAGGEEARRVDEGLELGGVEVARAWLARGARLVDARPRTAATPADVLSLSWQALAAPDGRLLDDDALARALYGDGRLRTGDAVVVVGAGRAGLGEDARLAWQLAYAGQARVLLVAGGAPAADALHAAPRATAPTQVLAARRRPTLRARDTREAQLLDVRSELEWVLGHPRDAHHLPWADLLDDRGFPRAPEDVRRRLRAVGITPDRPVVTACAAGVRSAWAWVVLRLAGAPARNLDGPIR